MAPLPAKNGGYGKGGLPQSLRIPAPDDFPGDGLGIQEFGKPPVHFMADVFPIAEAVLDEWDLVAGEDVEIGVQVFRK